MSTMEAYTRSSCLFLWPGIHTSSWCMFLLPKVYMSSSCVLLKEDATATNVLQEKAEKM